MAKGRTVKVAEDIQKELPAVHELMEQSSKANILIVKNAPQTSFADLIIVNTSTKELWLIQCKSFPFDEIELDCAGELAQMGHPDYPQKPEAGLYREALKQALGMTTVRYFLCVLVAPRLNPDTNEYTFPSAALARQFPQPLPRDVFVLSNAFGFQFTPMDLDYLTETGPVVRDWFAATDLQAASVLVGNGFQPTVPREQ
jgi:hypothetical protein